MSVSLFHKNIYAIGFLIALNCHTVYADDHIKQSTIAINGSHSVTVTHDKAIIKGSVITENIKAQQAVQDNATIIQKVRGTLKQAKIDPKKLLSSNYQLVTQYDYNNGKQSFKNYQVTHEISIETDNIDDIGKIADLLTVSGVNNIANIEFMSSKSLDAYNNALKNAVLDAKNKATLAISAIDTISLGKALTININPSQAPMQPIMYQAMEARTMMSKDASTSFQTKGQVITVDVNTIWEIINKP